MTTAEFDAINRRLDSIERDVALAITYMVEIGKFLRIEGKLAAIASQAGNVQRRRSDPPPGDAK